MMTSKTNIHVTPKILVFERHYIVLESSNARNTITLLGRPTYKALNFTVEFFHSFRRRFALSGREEAIK